MAFPHLAFGSAGDQFVNHTSSQTNLATTLQLSDGRQYAYGGNTSVAIGTARLCQQTLNSAEWDELAVPTARAVGDTTITLTNGSQAIVVDEFVNGYLNVEDDTGEGYLYTIKSNSVAAGSGVVTITLFEPLQVAWTTSTTVGIQKNGHGTVIIHPSPATALLIGVTPRAFPASTFGWFQTAGPASVLTEGTLVINENVIDSASADGAVAPTASTAAGEENYVGKTMEVAATTEESMIWLRVR